MSPRARSAMAVLILLALTESVYLRPSLLSGSEALYGSDYAQVHLRHIAFAREALFGARHTLPGWYQREFAGAPFAANLQSFPWIPTRFLLFLFDPEIAFAAGVAVAAALSALFTFLYCRRAGLSRLAAMAAGWTFACAGYFSSRVAAGHLPLLEAYPALPLLLWLTDRSLAPERLKRHALDLAALAVASASIAVAGHPQVPAYSFAAAFLYAAWRSRGLPRQAWMLARIWAAIGLGIGTTFAVLWPMLLLIGRSTRVLHLAPANNDIMMPWRRLLALVRPGIDGWAFPVPLFSQNPFHGYPNGSYFWDTVCYLGILPLIAIAALGIACLIRKRMPGSRWTFLAFLGTAAFLFALPLAQPLFRLLPGTILRSPCRLLYLWTFCAAVALGAAVDLFRRARLPGGRSAVYAVLALCLGLHFLDLWNFDRLFIVTDERDSDPPDFAAVLDRDLGDGRIAADGDLEIYKMRYDDVGGFDSIWLANYDRAIKALQGSSPDSNEQVLDGARLSVHTLQATAVRYVITERFRPDLEWVGTADDGTLYRVPNPAPRGAFFELPDHGADAAARVLYARPNSDQIRLQVETAVPGFVHLVETWDPGWTAAVDGQAASVLPADGFVMAVPVPRGSHSVVLRYHTPGRTTGAVLSLLSLCLLTVLLWAAKARRVPGHQQA